MTGCERCGNPGVVDNGMGLCESCSAQEERRHYEQQQERALADEQEAEYWREAWGEFLEEMHVSLLADGAVA